MCPSILMVEFEFSSFWSVISSGLFNLTARAQYTCFSIVVGMAVVHFLVGSDHLVSDKGPLEEVRRSLRSGLTEKWMNVILDLNGLLCVTEDSKSKGPGKEYNHCPSHVLSGMAPR